MHGSGWCEWHDTLWVRHHPIVFLPYGPGLDPVSSDVD